MLFFVSCLYNMMQLLTDINVSDILVWELLVMQLLKHKINIASVSSLSFLVMMCL